MDAGGMQEPASPPRQPTRRQRPLLTASALVLLILVGLPFALQSPWFREQMLRRASLPTLQAWAVRSPHDALLQYYLGTQYNNGGAPSAALGAFRRAAELDSGMPRAHIGVAAVQLNLGRFREARDAARRAASLQPRSVEAQLLLALAVYGSAQTEALGEFRRLAELAPRRADAWYWMGRCSRELDNFAAAREQIARAVELEPNNVTYRRELGGALMDLGRFEEARAEIERALSAAPYDPETLFLLARCLAAGGADTPDLQRAETLLARAAEQFRGKDPQREAAALLERGDLLRQLKRPAEASPLLMEARRLDPLSTRAPHLLALTAQATGRQADAARWFAEYERVNSQVMELSRVQQLVLQEQRNPSLRLRLARLYARAGNRTRAQEEYQNCLALQPENSAAEKELRALMQGL